MIKALPTMLGHTDWRVNGKHVFGAANSIGADLNDYLASKLDDGALDQAMNNLFPNGQVEVVSANFPIENLDGIILRDSANSNAKFTMAMSPPVLTPASGSDWFQWDGNFVFEPQGGVALKFTGTMVSNAIRSIDAAFLGWKLNTSTKAFTKTYATQYPGVAIALGDSDLLEITWTITAYQGTI